MIGAPANERSSGYEGPGIAGSGAIATGLAAVSTTAAETILLARSEASAWRAEKKVVAACAKIEGAEPSRLRVTTEPADLADCDVVVEAVVEELGPRARCWRRSTPPDPTPTWRRRPPRSASARSPPPPARRALGLHVFNPVPRMQLVEVCIPDGAAAAREKALAWCAALGKTAVEVPDQAGFVVNRLLFPYLFDAVRMVERTGMEAGEVDTCMKLGAGHPMGPLALLDSSASTSPRRSATPSTPTPRAGPQAARPDGRDDRRKQAWPQGGAGFYSYD